MEEIMRKIIYLIVGGIIGAMTGTALGIFAELCSCVFGNGGFDGYILTAIIGILGAIIGFSVGTSIDEEEKEKLVQQRIAEQEYQHRLEREARKASEEEERKRLEAVERHHKLEQETVERKRQKHLNKTKELLYNIAESFQHRDGIFETLGLDRDRGYKSYIIWSFKGGYDSIYNEVWCLKSEIASFGDSYLVQFNSLLQEHIQLLNEDIKNHLEELVNDECSSPYYNLECILHKIMLLKYANENDCKYDLTIHTIKNFIELLKKPMYFLESKEYGNFTLPLDMNENVFSVEDKLTYMLRVILDNSDGYYSNMSNCLIEEFLKLAGMLMWYYAKKQPFDVNKFNTACSFYEKYTIGNRVEKRNYYRSCPSSVKLEEFLAIIYSKLAIGGSALVQQEKQKIDDWIKDYHHNGKDVQILASALAWMELYDLELEILRYMVKSNIQMSPEVQERLKFLESGGASSNVKIYEIESENNFIYDSSSENWDTSDFNMFFRKIGMKKLTLNYSLSISTWKKTLPLLSGQKVSMNQLYQEFKSMINDFDGEVICKRTKAKAIDLDNVNYPDAVVFQFTSERNKCLSMLFSCEKFGRNLNLTIITLFTPENGIDVESLQKYAVAIKSNIYVDSFRETILQVVDEVIKVKRDIYNEDSNSSSGKKFVE